MCPTEDHEACVWHHTFLEVKGLDSGRQLPASWHFRVDSLWPLVLLGKFWALSREVTIDLSGICMRVLGLFSNFPSSKA